MKSIHDDIAAALERTKAGEPQQPEFDGDADDVLDMAVKEAGRRLRDEPESVGETFLSNVLKESNRAADRRAEKARREAEANQKKLDVLDVVKSSSLPEERKRELIEQEIARLRALIVDLQEHLQDER